MKHPEKSSATTNAEPTVAPEPELPPTANSTLGKTDRPGFDLGGASGDTDAGTGLGLGTDAFDPAGDKRRPGRRPENKLTIPHWSGPEPHGGAKPAHPSPGRKVQSSHQTKRGR
jgi:hypothetical protein